MGGKLLRIPGGVEVAGKTHTTDDQLPHLTLGHGHPEPIDHSEIPAVEWQADAHGHAAVEQGCTRHHGRLGGTVGVPHLPAVDREPLAQLGRAGLAAEDQQSHIFERLDRPQRGEGGYGRHDGDAAGRQPRAEIEPAAHERSRSGYQTGTAGPCQPHLFSGRVEGDRQSGQHTVTGTERFFREKQSRFCINEGGGRPVAHRDSFRGSGRARSEDDPGVIVDRGCVDDIRR